MINYFLILVLLMNFKTGLDNSRPLIHEHSKRLLLNLLLLLVPHGDPFLTARTFLSNHSINEASHLFSNKYSSNTIKESAG